MIGTYVVTPQLVPSPVWQTSSQTVWKQAVAVTVREGDTLGELICLKIIMISFTQLEAAAWSRVPPYSGLRGKQDARVTIILSSFSMYQKRTNPRNWLCFLLFGYLARTLNVNLQRNGGLVSGGNDIAL